MVEQKAQSVQVTLPSGIEVNLEGNTFLIKGAKGSVKKRFSNPRIEILKQEDKLVIKTKDGIKPIQTDKNFINTCRAHLKNMIQGVIYGYTAKVKICSGHFPMQVSSDANSVSVKNFLGEKVPRKADILPEVKVKISGDIIEVTGLDKEAVSQTAARIEQSTRITNRDRTIFQDGCFIIQKAEVTQSGH